MGSAIRDVMAHMKTDPLIVELAAVGTAIVVTAAQEASPGATASR